MSRIGNRELQIPTGVTVTLNDNMLTVKGPKGELSLTISNLVNVEVSDTSVKTNVANETPRANVMQGTTNSLIHNMLIGKAELVSNTEITLSGIDKQKVSEFAANVRKVRKPEPYKGKGIRYKDEYVRRKEGKKAA